MMVGRYIDLALEDPRGEAGWSAAGWANYLTLLMHRLELQIREVDPQGIKVLWPSLRITIEETKDDLGTNVLRVHAEVEMQERDA